MSIQDVLIHQLTDDIKQTLDSLQAFNLDTRLASKKITECIQLRLGGGKHYIPVLDNAGRNQQIRASFKGNNHAELCKQFNISLSHLYRIIKKK